MEIMDRSGGLGRHMLRYRARTGKSQRQCAAEAKMSLQTWYSVENGYQSPSKLTRKKIEILIGLDTDDEEG